jgi:small subunit ribosomal protein S12
MTYNQLGGRHFSKGRVTKKRRAKAPAFKGAPHKKAIIYKLAVMSPRKPNSARRTFAKVRIVSTDKKLFAKIPGIGDHYLQAHSLVFLRGHGPKDSPGINYHLVIGVCDFIREENFGRKNRRSKFGLKKKKEI